MEPTNILYRQADMAYRTSYLTEQLQRPGARDRHRSGRPHRRWTQLRWHSHPTTTD